ncbi:putative ATPases of the AAA+ class [Thiomonas sp. X19]|uniref:AAA family ATPase n=1 Tax=Thiomonas sp. X19 TaxID=1050370 RepID=UPI000B6DDF99|nr:ATP-binding protein [Thiomonas sp. X19]SCC93595.1 putative ATPases of the AAA+ class [Thiomonas sp. X19]SCC94708.1 putative ATPases of the AAA+ class [Thiomonas sp. X19]
MRRSRHELESLIGRDNSPQEPIVHLWMLRMLVPMGGLRVLIRESIGVPDLLTQLGISSSAIDDGGSLNAQARQASTLVKQMWERAERTAHKLTPSEALVANIGRLAALVNLSPTECRILEFASLLHAVRDLDDTADSLGQLSTSRTLGVLEKLLGLPESEVKQALSSSSQLARCGLLTLARNGHCTLKGKLDLLSDNFADAILAPDTEPLSLLRGVVTPSPPSKLQLSDYPHLGLNLQMLQGYLQETQAQHKPGVNILLYGPPGTGKTELSRTLAHELGCDLFEVSTEDDEGDPIGGEARLRAYRAAQRFLERRRVMILFDEIEDVFNTEEAPSMFNGLFRRSGGGRERKGWINKSLEANPVPTFWLTNSIRSLDAAYIRRFDFVLELPVPPQRVRETIATECVGELADAPTLRALASSNDLAPAVLTRAASVLQTIQSRIPTGQSNTALLQLVNNTLQAQGHARVKASDPNRLPDTYDPAFIHADTDLAAMAAGIQQAGSARLCLYGPPGTGKTAYARWLARRLDRPLLVKRASDLLSKWLGESEQNIAQAFQQAESDGAVLLIDEVDSFLQERRGATHSWEVTQVNEMLTQMEAFSGVFIATTNLMDDLDEAALRRFDLKARFDYLTPEQAWALLRRQCSHLDLPSPEPGLRKHLDRLGLLTPGDFAAVIRCHRFQPMVSARSLVEALSAECALKQGHKAAIGFV